MPDLVIAHDGRYHPAADRIVELESGRVVADRSTLAPRSMVGP